MLVLYGGFLNGLEIVFIELLSGGVHLKPVSTKIHITFFLLGKQNQILNANNPKGVGEIIAINDEKSKLEDIAARKYKNLTYEDRKRVDDLLDERDY